MKVDFPKGSRNDDRESKLSIVYRLGSPWTTVTTLNRLLFFGKRPNRSMSPTIYLVSGANRGIGKHHPLPLAQNCNSCC